MYYVIGLQTFLVVVNFVAIGCLNYCFLDDSRNSDFSFDNSQTSLVTSNHHIAEEVRCNEIIHIIKAFLKLHGFVVDANYNSCCSYWDLGRQIDRH